MKQGTTALVATAVLLAGTTALAAQALPPPGYYDARAYYGRGASPYVYAPEDDTMPAQAVVPILRARGFQPLSRAVRRGAFYLVSAVHPRGEEGRVVVDAYTGQIVRFIPATEVRASRRDEMVLVYQGPTFPPPNALRSGPPPGTMRGAPRPPAPVPSLASRAPASAPLVTPKPRPQSAPQKPETAQAPPPIPAPVETKPAAASPPLVQMPVEKKPAVQPTRPLPPVQTME
jgi:hypothetical protein